MTARRIWLILAGFALVLLVPALFLVRPLLQQESAGTLVQAVRMELGSADIVELADRDDAWLIKARSPGIERLMGDMEAEGLAYVEQLGSHRFFDDGDGGRVALECVMYSTRFMTCDRHADF